MDYQTEEFETEISVSDYMAQFRDSEKFIACCRQCHNYGRSWACPPFGFDCGEVLSRYRLARIFAVKITPSSPLKLDGVDDLIRPERVRIEHRLLELERQTGGRAFSYVGSCIHCGGAPCARISNQPCRHPDKVRPSLEAFGFDISLTLRRLFGIELKWGENGSAPEYIVLVSAMFV